MKKKKKVTDECREIIGYFGNLCSTLFIKIKVQKAYLKKGKKSDRSHSPSSFFLKKIN
jgi:hypothetical protein